MKGREQIAIHLSTATVGPPHHPAASLAANPAAGSGAAPAPNRCSAPASVQAALLDHAVGA